MKITIIVFWVLVVVSVMAFLFWLIPSNLYLKQNGCLFGKPAMAFQLREVCR